MRTVAPAWRLPARVPLCLTVNSLGLFWHVPPGGLLPWTTFGPCCHWSREGLVAMALQGLVARDVHHQFVAMVTLEAGHVTLEMCCHGDPWDLLPWWHWKRVVIVTTETPLSWQMEHGFYALGHRMNWQIGWDCLKDFTFSHHRKTIAMRLHVFERAFSSTVIYGLFCCNNSHKEQQSNVLILYGDICNTLSLFLTYLYPYAMR